ncbi:hypothetical protein [Tropicimonas marinistellae]|uniref:hypothetical protein n=1 Tax=Tropicimonas marinistellae TaxID=1739787 RepID=UPI000835A61A|nr:hypothetical protein [Tropicimonas marinistellae]
MAIDLVAKRTAWTRIWTSLRGDGIEEGLAMRVADPAWMLARQWQFGALTGDDAGSPARVEITRRQVPVTHFAGHDTPAWSRLETAVPLEAQAEPMATSAGPAVLLREARAGLQFLRRFDGADRVALRTLLVEKAGFSDAEKRHAKDVPELRALMLAGLHGKRLSKVLEDLATDIARVTAKAQTDVETEIKAWQTYYAGRFAEPKRGGAWDDSAMRYRLKTRNNAARANRIALTADRHDGGRLDWFSFDVIPGSPGTKKLIGARRTHTLYPTPVRYSGMPADTLWDFEEGQVYFGGLGAGRTDLAQMLVTEFATAFSNDWFLMPMRVPAGTLNRIVSMKVHDTWGDTVTLASAAANDGAGRSFRFFELDGDVSANAETGARTPWLYLPRVVEATKQGRVLERVVFSRDEQANLAWAVEAVIEGPDGRPVDRTQHWARLRDQYRSYLGDSTMPEPDPEAEAWVYRLLSASVPPHWVPFVPEIESALATGRLLRARLQEWDLLGPAKTDLAGAKGQILAPDRPFTVQDEEIAPGGTEVTRAFQSTRGADGKLRVWLARRRRPAGRLESAGRLTDVVERGRK